MFEGDIESARARLAWLEKNADEDFVEAARLSFSLLNNIKSLSNLDANPQIGQMALGALNLLLKRGISPFSSTGGLRLPIRLKEDTGAMIAAIPGYLVGYNKQPIKSAFQRMMTTRPEALIIAFHGALLFQERKLAEAEAEFIRAAEAPAMFDETSDLALTMAASTAYLQSRQDENSEEHLRRALSYLKRRLERGPLSKMEATLIAPLAFIAKDFHLAARIGEEALARDPENEDLIRLLMKTYYRIGAFESSLIHAQAILNKHPEDKSALDYREKCQTRIKALEELDKQSRSSHMLLRVPSGNYAFLPRPIG